MARNASEADIKKAFRRLAMKYHPDRNTGDAATEAKFKEVKLAYDVLSDRQEAHPPTTSSAMRAWRPAPAASAVPGTSPAAGPSRTFSEMSSATSSAVAAAVAADAGQISAMT